MPLGKRDEHVALIARDAGTQQDEANRVRQHRSGVIAERRLDCGLIHVRIAAAIISSLGTRIPTPVEVVRIVPSSISRLSFANDMPKRSAAVICAKCD